MSLSDLLIIIPAVLICLTIHEFFHGYIAYKLGDSTAQITGRLSLNPIKHIDPIGFLCLVFFRFGWAKPVPVNTRYFKNPKRDLALTALAGPLSNFVLSFLLLLISALLYNFTWLYYLIPRVISALIVFLMTTAVLSAGLGVFNLIPVPPLDGSKIIIPMLPAKILPFFLKYEFYFQFVILILLFTGVLTGVLVGARSIVLKGLYAVVSLLLGIFGLDTGFMSVFIGV